MRHHVRVEGVIGCVYKLLGGQGRCGLRMDQGSLKQEVGRYLDRMVGIEVHLERVEVNRRSGIRKSECRQHSGALK